MSGAIFTTADQGMMILKSDDRHLRDLEKATAWLGIGHGRVAEYRRIYLEFLGGKRGREHILGFNETCEITEMFDLWEKRADDYPGIKEKIKRSFMKGPPLREDEKPGKSDKPRNDAFVYFLAGRFLAAGLNVISIDGVDRLGVSLANVTDITLGAMGEELAFECKRPQSLRAAIERVKEAEKQILKRTNRMGIIAVDCSAFIRPNDKVLGSASEHDAQQFLGRLLEERVFQSLRQAYDPRILGLILFGRVPLITSRESPILDVRGKPYMNHRRHSLSAYTFVTIHGAVKPRLFSICRERLGKYMGENR